MAAGHHARTWPSRGSAGSVAPGAHTCPPRPDGLLTSERTATSLGPWVSSRRWRTATAGGAPGDRRRCRSCSSTSTTATSRRSTTGSPTPLAAASSSATSRGSTSSNRTPPRPWTPTPRRTASPGGPARPPAGRSTRPTSAGSWPLRTAHRRRRGRRGDRRPARRARRTAAGRLAHRHRRPRGLTAPPGVGRARARHHLQPQRRPRRPPAHRPPRARAGPGRGAGADGLLRREPDRLEVAGAPPSPGPTARCRTRTAPAPSRRSARASTRCSSASGCGSGRPPGSGPGARRPSTPSSRRGTSCCSAPTPSFELGAALGIPFLTAHRCLTVAESLPDRLGPGALTGHTVLVQGGAGAVGNAAIQLARWADATVIATVSSPAQGPAGRRGRRRPRRGLPGPGRGRRGPQDRARRASTRSSRCPRPSNAGTDAR